MLYCPNYNQCQQKTFIANLRQKMKRNLQELSDQELLKETKNAKFVFGIFIGLIIAMVVSGVISTLKHGMNVFTFLPLVFLGVAMAFWSHYTKVKKELKSRNIE